MIRYPKTGPIPVFTQNLVTNTTSHMFDFKIKSCRCFNVWCILCDYQS